MFHLLLLYNLLIYLVVELSKLVYACYSLSSSYTSINPYFTITLFIAESMWTMFEALHCFFLMFVTIADS